MKKIKKYIQNNKIAITMLIILFVVITIICYGEKIRYIYTNEIKSVSYAFCEIINKYEEINVCKDLSNFNYTYDTFSIMNNVLSTKFFNYFLMTIPMFMIYISLKEVQKEINSQTYKYKLNRMSYQKYIGKIIKKAYKYIFLIPIIFIYIIIWSYSISGHFDSTLAVQSGFENYKYLCDNNIIFIITYIISIIFCIAYCINIGLIIMKKSNNIIITVISSTIIYYFIHIVNEFILIPYVWGKFVSEKILFYFDFLDPYSINGIDSLLLNVLRFLIPYFISLIILVLSYKNKEKNIIEFEKTEK